MLVEGIAVVTDIYETKRIILSRYGDRNRIIQAHLDNLENVQPIRYPTPDALNSAFINCHRRNQTLRVLEEDVIGYGRVIASKILRTFPDDMSTLDCPREAAGPLCRGHPLINSVREGGSERGSHHPQDTRRGRKTVRL
jgi:hypothetical protein